MRLLMSSQGCWKAKNDCLYVFQSEIVKKINHQNVPCHIKFVNIYINNPSSLHLEIDSLVFNFSTQKSRYFQSYLISPKHLLFQLILIFTKGILQFYFQFAKQPKLMASADYDFVFKTLLIGNSSVGKSSLLLRFSDNIFQETFYPTIGVDFKIRTFDLEGSVVKLQMWDTAGQEKFKTITSAYYKGAQGVILVFDLCDRKSFEDIQNWMGQIEKYSHREVVRLLVGNKCDLYGDRQVTRQEAERFAQNEGMIYMEASAKSNKNVETIFTTLSKEMKNLYVKAPLEKEDRKQKKKTTLVPHKPENAKPTKSSCC